MVYQQFNSSHLLIFYAIFYQFSKEAFATGKANIPNNNISSNIFESTDSSKSMKRRYLRSENGICLICETGVNGLKRPSYLVESAGISCALIAVGIAASSASNSQECQNLIYEYREICCGENEPEALSVSSKKPSTSSQPSTSKRPSIMPSTSKRPSAMPSTSKQPLTVPSTQPSATTSKAPSTFTSKAPSLGRLEEQSIPVSNEPIRPNPICHICSGRTFPREPNTNISIQSVITASCAQFYEWGVDGEIPQDFCSEIKAESENFCGC